VEEEVVVEVGKFGQVPSVLVIATAMDNKTKQNETKQNKTKQNKTKGEGKDILQEELEAAHTMALITYTEQYRQMHPTASQF
jgi:hypothetical protein